MQGAGGQTIKDGFNLFSLPLFWCHLSLTHKIVTWVYINLCTYLCRANAVARPESPAPTITTVCTSPSFSSPSFLLSSVSTPLAVLVALHLFLAICEFLVCSQECPPSLQRMESESLPTFRKGDIFLDSTFLDILCCEGQVGAPWPWGNLGRRNCCDWVEEVDAIIFVIVMKEPIRFTPSASPCILHIYFININSIVTWRVSGNPISSPLDCSTPSAKTFSSDGGE